MRIPRMLAVLAIGMIAVFVTVAPASAATGKFTRAPVYDVGPSPVSAGVGEQLMELLGLQGNPYSELDGALRYMDPSLFLQLPTDPTGFDGNKDEGGMQTSAESLDLSAARAEPPSSNLALDNTFNALSEVDLMDNIKALTGRASVAHARLQSIGTDAGPLDVPLDTEVLYRFSLNGRPLIGPGAKARVSFSGDGEVSQLLFNFPSVTKGENIRLITPQLAAQQAQALTAGCGGGFKTQLSAPKIVYYAPSSLVDQIFPWYEFDGLVYGPNVNPGQAAQLRTTLVPAVLDGALKAAVSARSVGGVVVASVKPRGGTAPYSYQWSSCSTTLDPSASTGQSLQYAPTSRDPSAGETLTVKVTDANGLVTVARTKLPLTVPGSAGRNLFAPRGISSASSIPRIDAGIEWIGNCGGLPGSAVSANGFVNNMTALGGVPIQFNWGDNNAWEQDFKDPSKGGDDSSYADDVDLTFYTGHASYAGWWFCNPNHTDQNMTNSDAALGNRDLEWLGIAACGPLQASGGGLAWWQRWGPTFRGLHLLMGYATTSFDNNVEGPNFALYLNGIPGLGWLGFGPNTVRQSWIQMAMDAQPSSVNWAVMGISGPGNVSNWNDYFWGKGPTGPDIVPPSSPFIAPGYGYWWISGPS